MGVLLPEMYKQTRNSKPFNIIKYLTSTLISIIFDVIIFLIFKTSFSNMIKNERGDTASIMILFFICI